MKWRLFVGPLVLLAGWSVISLSGAIRPIFLPAPWDVAEALFSLSTSGLLVADTASTLYRTCIAFLLAAGAGLLLGIPLGAWKGLYESVEVVFDFFRSLPSPALIPLAMLLLGLGDASRIAVAAFTCTLVNAIQIAYAVHGIPRARITAARLAGAKGLFLARHVLFPSILPGVIAGWRVTLSLSLIIVVVSEMFIGTRSGLGMRIYDLHLMFRSAEMYAAILVVGLAGYGLNKGLELTERRLVHWVGR